MRIWTEGDDGDPIHSCPDATYGRQRQLHVPEAPIRLPDVPLRPLSWRRRLFRKIEDVRQWVRMKRIIWADRGVGASTRKGEDALPLSEAAGQGSSLTPDAEREVVTRFAAPTPPLTDRELPAQPNGQSGRDAGSSVDG